MERDAPAAARVLLSLSIACWAGRMDPGLPDVVQHGPLLALTFKPRQQHVVFPLTVQISIYSQSGKTTNNKTKTIRNKDKSEIA